MDGPGRAHGAITRGILDDEDVRRIAEAIREGLAKKPDSPRGGPVLRSWVTPGFGLAILLTSYIVLTNWRPAIAPQVRTTALPEAVVFDHKTAHRDDGWRLPSGQVQSLTVHGPHATPLRVDLPIPTEQCARIAARLGTECRGTGFIVVHAPIEVAWSAPQPLKFDPVRPVEESFSSADQVRLTLTNAAPPTTGATGDTTARSPGAPGAVPGSPGVPAGQAAALTVWADTGMSEQRWCFSYRPPAATTLTVTSGTRTYDRLLTPANTPNLSCDGLRLWVTPGPASGQGATGPPVVTLGGISSIQVETSGHAVNVSALTGTALLEDDRTKVFDAPTQALIQSRERIRTTLNVQAGSASFALNATRVTGFNTDDGNQVRTAWQREKEIALPVFLGLVGLMTPLLGAAYRNTFDYLMAQPTLLRRNLRRIAGWLWWPVGALLRVVTSPFRWARRLRRRPPGVPPAETT